MFFRYGMARKFFIENPDVLIRLENYVMNSCCELIRSNCAEIKEDYNEASYLHPFWSNYPPEDRGRAPKGDQIPWIEVGEHAVGHKLERFFAQKYTIREVGLPSGADDRFILQSDEIYEITQHQTNQAMVFLDIKSVGPRDDAEHTVLSPYQVSGDGIWNTAEESMRNSPMIATGNYTSHRFFPAIPPIYVLSKGTIAPTIHIFVKPIYKMLSLLTPNQKGQPLKHIRVACVPNGILLTQNPNYLKQYPGLFFPGKDEKTKSEGKKRCRVSFEILTKIANWRVTTESI